MAVAKGSDLRAAIAKGTTWGTIASDPTSNSLKPLLGTTIKKSVELIQNLELNDSSGRGASDAGNYIVEGAWKRNLHYQGDELLQALLFGTSGSPVQVGSTVYYTHRYTSKSSLQGLFATLFEDRQTSTWEVDSAKVAGMTINGGVGGRVEVEYRFIGADLDTAGNIAFGSCTQNANSVNNHVLASHLAFKINDSSGGDGSDVASETALAISDFSIQFDNALTPVRTTGTEILEPTRDGFLQVTGSITIPTYENNTRIADVLDKSLQKCSFVFTSGSYSYSVFIPAFRWTGDLPDVSGPGRVPLVLNFEYEEATANPTGMNSTLPYVEIVSQVSADPLA